MPPRVETLTTFGGLNLIDDPQEAQVTATDMMNVILRKGRIIRRNGYSKFTTSAASGRFQDLDTASGYVFGVTAAATNNLLAYSGGLTAAASATASAGTNLTTLSSVPIGTSTNQYVYIGTSVGTTAATDKVWRFDTAAPGAFTNVTASYTSPGGLLGFSPTDNRLMMASPSDASATVRFSDAGAPETFTTTSFVSLWPNDGGFITSMVTWRELSFVFKPDKFFVFTGNSVAAGTGTPVFNYRSVVSQAGGVPYHAGAGTHSLATAGRDAVYFANDAGVWETTGGAPSKISGAVDVLFNGSYFGAPQADTQPYAGAQFKPTSLVYCDDELFVAGVDTVTSTPRLLAYDLRTSQWTIHTMPIQTMCAIESTAGSTSLTPRTPRVYFGYASGTNDIGLYQPHIFGYPGNATDAGGGTVTGYYRTGALDFGTPMAEKWVREWKYDGIGTWSVGVTVNDDWTVPGSTSFANLSTVTLGTIVTGTRLAEGYDRTGSRGRNFQVYMSTTDRGGQINRLSASVWSERPAFLKAGST